MELSPYCSFAKILVCMSVPCCHHKNCRNRHMACRSKYSSAAGILEYMCFFYIKIKLELFTKSLLLFQAAEKQMNIVKIYNVVTLSLFKILSAHLCQCRRIFTFCKEFNERNFKARRQGDTGWGESRAS